jgi:hypothetical protein
MGAGEEGATEIAPVKSMPLRLALAKEIIARPRPARSKSERFCAEKAGPLDPFSNTNRPEDLEEAGRYL